ncbi:ISAs1 family transposase [Microbispora sp. NBC_01389]|uniref:ISAs1 family transposase n=1 Tax=Microbispora sp. NBC_01389 TaxID=2903584 RepID=UPI0032521D9C
MPADTTEVTRVKALLEGVDTARALVTADAAHTCAKTARHLVEDTKADYLMCVKGNREALHAAAVEVGRVLLNSGQAPHTLTKHDHGRITTWTTWSTDLDGELDLPHAARLAVLRRVVADPIGRPVSKEVVLCVTSRKDLTGEGFSRYVRGHWGIENLEHRARGTVWYEDAQQAYLGHGPRNMAALRNLALSALALHGIMKICRRPTRRLQADPQTRRRALY